MHIPPAMLAAAALLSAQAHGQGAPPPAFHEAIPEAIVVTAPFRLNRADLLSSVSVVTGAELVRDLRSTIGETLARQPGVSATSFGPSASRPILRGLQGERVRILTDGIGAFDVSNTSVDHAVAINPLLAERIEVVRGPASLLFGSSAIGGVVNIIDTRIPRRVPDEFAHLEAIGGYGSAADEWFVGGALDVPVAGKLVLHADGSYRDTGDLRIGGPVLSQTLRDQAIVNGLPELAQLSGRLPNTKSEFKDFAGGLTYIDDGGSLGIAVSRLENTYGVPIRFSVDPEAPVDAVSLAIEQTRLDARGEVAMTGLFESLRVRFGYADYRHAEITTEGAIGTQFFNTSFEGRAELNQTKRGAWRAVYGAQVVHRDFNVVGDEAFVPRNLTDQVGIFTLHSLDFGAVRAEIGGRYEHGDVKSRDGVFPAGPVSYKRNFDVWSGSVGASLGLGGDWRGAISLSRSERAPAAEELLANGPHAGTQAFEIGNPDFKTEKSLGGEISLRGGGRGYTVSIGGYYNDFEDYIDLVPTGDIEDGLPVFQFIQAGARYWGLEGEASLVLGRVGGFDLSADALGDYTSARIKGFGPAPRIPPFRVRGGLQARSDRFVLRGEVEHSGRQDRIAVFETATAAFTLINASIAFRPLGAHNPTSITLEGSNLTNANARRHASFLKDYAPLAGREVRATARLSF